MQVSFSISFSLSLFLFLAFPFFPHFPQTSRMIHKIKTLHCNANGFWGRESQVMSFSFYSSLPSLSLSFSFPYPQFFLSLPTFRYFIDEAERIGFQDLSKEYEPKYRNSKRLLVSSRFMAKTLYSRIEYAQKRVLKKKGE